MTVIYSAECKAAQKATRPVAMLPILVVLFVFSYAILAMLVFEQGQTIESQRGLIREMLKDSTELATLRGRIAHDGSLRLQQKSPASAPMAAPPAQQQDSTKNGKDAKRAGKSTHSTRQAPGKPAADLEDVRRSTRVI